MRVLIVGEGAEARGACRTSALGAGWECGPDDCVAFPDLALRLARYPDVHLVLVLLEPNPAVAAQAVDSVTGRPVVVVTQAEVSAGGDGRVRVWPASSLKEHLAQAAADILPDPAAAKRGRVVAVTAALPGTGATTIATGLAFALAGSESVLLAELGAPVPELALNLDLTVPHSLGDLLRAGDRMDASMIRHAAVRHASGVDVLAYPADTLAVAPVVPGIVKSLHVLLRASHDWTVVDAGHSQTPGNADLCRRADAVILAVRLDPPSLRLTCRFLEGLKDAGVSDVTLVTNRYGQPGQVAWKKAEAALPAPVKAWLPDDPRAVNQALGEGKPLATFAPRSSLSRELARLAADVRAKFATPS